MPHVRYSLPNLLRLSRPPLFSIDVVFGRSLAIAHQLLELAVYRVEFLRLRDLLLFGRYIRADGTLYWLRRWAAIS